MTQRSSLTENFKKIRQNLHFVMVEPESPGNIGSAARAMKTCGFSKMILVNPAKVDEPEMRMLAHRSRDIVYNAAIVSTFEEAIGDKALVMATTMRKRHFRFPFFTPEEAAARILPVALQQPVAIVFGSERNGLSNEQLLQCHMHSSAPTATQNPSLNLAQAVMVYAYTFFREMNDTLVTFSFELATQQELEIFYNHLQDALNLVHFVPRDGIDNFITRIRRLIGRAMAEQRDVRLLHKLLQVFETRIKDLEGPDAAPAREIY